MAAEQKESAASLGILMQETSLLNFLARVPQTHRGNEWERIKDQIHEGGFAHKVAMLLTQGRQDPKTLVQTYAIWLLNACGNRGEATALEKAVKDSSESTTHMG